MKTLICDVLLIKRYYVTYYVRYKGHGSISTDDLNRKKKKEKKAFHMTFTVYSFQHMKAAARRKASIQFFQNS